MREWHIWDLPQDKIRVRLNEVFCFRFFNSLEKLLTSQTKLIAEFNIHRNTIYQWKYGKRYIPLSFLLKFSKILYQEDMNKYKELETNITSIKSVGSRNKEVIYNPKLPIKETPELFRIISNLICDGYAGDTQDRIHGQMYCNLNEGCINKFLTSLNFVFGDVYTKRLNDGTGVSFPNTVIYILKHFYKIDFATEKSHLPEEFLNYTDDYLNEIIATFIDDEGSIADSYVQIIMKNRLLILFLDKICKKLELKSRLSKSRIYDRILIYDLNKVKNLPIAHTKKIQDLNFEVSRKNNKKRKNTKNVILKLLNTRSYNSKELSRNIGIAAQTIRRHMRELEKENKVTKDKNYIWRRL